MKINKLYGCGTALITPFTKEGEVDYDAYKEHLKRQVEANIHFLVALGTTAETPCLSSEEKHNILKITKEIARDKPIIVGAGSNSTQATIENIKDLEQFSPDGFLIVTPYYNKPTQEGLYQHFANVAASTSLPIILYNVPGRTGVNLNPETTLKLAQIENIIGIKEASGNYSQICQIIQNAPNGFKVFSGNDDETLSLMASGATGVISVASNLDPNRMYALTEAIISNDLKKAKTLHYELLSLFKNCFVESNPIPAKAGLAKMGYIENILRLPLCPATDKTMSLMTETLKNLGLN